MQLAEQPVTAYTGGIKGLQATKPRKGQKIDPNSPAVVNYRSFLESRQQAVLGSVGGGDKVHSYGYVFNGFAAELTAEQAQKLAQTQGRARGYRRTRFRELVTATTPDFLGLTRYRWRSGRPRPRARTSSSASSTAASGRST